MYKTNKKAFTLIEMAIVMIILSIVIGSAISMNRASYQKNRLNETKESVYHIKRSILGYAAIHHRLPYPDSDTAPDGLENNTATDLGYLPYIDLQTSSKDEFGMNYMYDANNSLFITNTATELCEILESIQNAAVTPYPRIANDDNSSISAVAAIVISKGIDKVLTGKNDDNSRTYEMRSNTYDATTNDDFTIEITTYELHNRLCTNIVETIVYIDNNETNATAAATIAVTENNNTGADMTYTELEPMNFLVTTGDANNNKRSYKISSNSAVCNLINQIDAPGTTAITDINSSNNWITFYPGNNCQESPDTLILSFTALHAIDINNNYILDVDYTSDKPVIIDD